VSDRRTEAAATLAGLGLDPEAVAAGRAPETALRELIAGPEGARLASALGELAEPAVAALLVGLEPYARDRGARKEVRRALYRLRQRGVPVPEPPVAAGRSIAAVAAPEPSAWLPAFGGGGDRIMWLERPLLEGGALFVYAHVHEPRGLLDVSVAEAGRKRLRELKERVAAELKVTLVPADWRVIDALLVEASERSAAGESHRDYLRIRPRITPDPPRPPAEPVSPRVDPPAAEEAAALAAASEALFAEPEFQSWGPDPEAAAPFIAELTRVRESPIVLTPLQQEDRAREIVGRAVAALAPPPVMARRLEGTAYVLAQAGRTEVARRALGVARVLRDHPADAVTVPFVGVFVHRALGGFLAADDARREEERRSSLVVTPGEFLRDRSSSRPGRTRG
jgi:hypothetical protein